MPSACPCAETWSTAGPLCLLRHIGQLSTNKLVRLSGRADLAEMVVAAGSREAAPLEPIHRAPKASPPAGSPDRPSLHLRERNSSMKNRKRESCTSGTVRDEDGNILIYSARRQRPFHTRHSRRRQLAKGRNRGRWSAGGAAGAMGIWACAT